MFAAEFLFSFILSVLFVDDAIIPWTVSLSCSMSAESWPMIFSVASLSGSGWVTSSLHLNWSDHLFMFALYLPMTSPTLFLGIFIDDFVVSTPLGGVLPAMALVVVCCVVDDALAKEVRIALAIVLAAVLRFRMWSLSSITSSVGRLSVSCRYFTRLVFGVISILAASILLRIFASTFLSLSWGSSGISKMALCLARGRLAARLMIMSVVSSATSPLLMWLVPHSIAKASASLMALVLTSM